jgi:SAM-dependent methyltransferase
MGRPFFYKILDIPSVYRLCSRIVAPGAMKFAQPHILQHFSNATGLVLDVGCGPNPSAPLPQGTLVGLDSNFNYVSSYVTCRSTKLGEQRSAQTNILGVTGDAIGLPFLDNSFDECRALALFHHLDDTSLEKTLIECYRVLKPGGRLVFFDAIWPDSVFWRPLAALTLSLDRGEFFRTETELLALLEKSTQGSWSLNRFTYTYTGLEGVIFTHLK